VKEKFTRGPGGAKFTSVENQSGKFMGGLTNFVGGMNQRFTGKLPAILVMPFAYILPFGELICGLLIVLGLFTRVGLVISGLLLIGLTLAQ
jgi:uncharacterized membrane protein YphA (DoxX/SURF4 family)